MPTPEVRIGVQKKFLASYAYRLVFWFPLLNVYRVVFLDGKGREITGTPIEAQEQPGGCFAL